MKIQNKRLETTTAPYMNVMLCLKLFDMLKPFFDWLNTNYPGIFALILIIGFFIWVTNLATGFYHRFAQLENRVGWLETRVDTEIIPRLDRMQESLNGLQNAVNAILIYLKAKDEKIGTSLMQAKMLNG